MDKTLLKIAGIVSIIIGVICCITIFGAIIGIPIIIGGVKFNEFSELSDEELLAKKEAIIIWTIVFVFINQIGAGLVAIFLAINWSSFFKNNTQSSGMNKYDELDRLKRLYDEKAITKEEYETEKQKVLNK